MNLQPSIPARYIFRDAMGDPPADALLRALRTQAGGLTRTALHSVLGRHRQGQAIGRALDQLEVLGLARRELVTTPGRPAERWFAVSPRAKQANEAN